MIKILGLILLSTSAMAATSCPTFNGHYECTYQDGSDPMSPKFHGTLDFKTVCESESHCHYVIADQSTGNPFSYSFYSNTAGYPNINVAGFGLIKSTCILSDTIKMVFADSPGIEDMNNSATAAITKKSDSKIWGWYGYFEGEGAARAFISTEFKCDLSRR